MTVHASKVESSAASATDLHAPGLQISELSIAPAVPPNTFNARKIFRYLARLRDGVDGLTDADLCGEEVAGLVHREEHARPHGGYKQVEEVREFAANRGLHVQARMHESQQARQGPRCSAKRLRFHESEPKLWMVASPASRRIAVCKMQGLVRCGNALAKV